MSAHSSLQEIRFNLCYKFFYTGSFFKKSIPMQNKTNYISVYDSSIKVLKIWKWKLCPRNVFGRHSATRIMGSTRTKTSAHEHHNLRSSSPSVHALYHITQHLHLSNKNFTLIAEKQYIIHLLHYNLNEQTFYISETQANAYLKFHFTRRFT
jgi:hypothetical protein